jgi:dolichol-phosphate mannosyltransferase
LAVARRDRSTVVVIPTYNERENIKAIVPAICTSVPGVNVWIVDDNSPDGTGALADELANCVAGVRVFHRPQKSGLGTAYIESFQLALEEGFEHVVEMDADFSHDPRVLPELLKTAQEADLVLGSRYVPGGSTPDWTLPRRIISHVGNVVARLVLGIPVHDATTGYRVFNRKALSTLHLEGIRLQGYGFQIETVYQCHRAGLTIREYPICFIDRRAGQSKMSQAIVVEALLYVFRRRFSHMVRRSSSDEPRNVGGYDEPPKYAD